MNLYQYRSLHTFILSLISVSAFSLQAPEGQSRVATETDGMVKWLNKRKVRSFYTPFASDSLRGGTRQLMQVTTNKSVLYTPFFKH